MTDEPTIRIRDGSLVTREEYDKSEQYVQEVQKAKANRQVKSDSSPGSNDLRAVQQNKEADYVWDGDKWIYAPWNKGEGK